MAKHYKRLRPLLGTFVEIGVVATGLKYEVGVTKAFDAIEKIQRLLSFQDPNSDLSILNQSYSQEVVLNPISIRVLRLAQSMTRASGGLFNFTVGGKLIDLGVLPNHSKKAVLPSGGADDLIISGRNSKILGVQADCLNLLKLFWLKMTIVYTQPMRMVFGFIHLIIYR